MAPLESAAKFEMPTSDVVNPSKFCNSVVGFGGSANGSASPLLTADRRSFDAPDRDVERRTIARPPPPGSLSSSRSLIAGAGGAFRTISLSGDETSLIRGAVMRTGDAAPLDL